MHISCLLNTRYLIGKCHFFWKNPSRVLDELQRVLEPGGRLVLCVNDRVWLREQVFAREGFSFYDLRAIERLLASAKFDAIEPAVARDPLQGPIHWIRVCAQ